MGALVEKISLFFKQGSSDKYYNIAIEEVETDLFMVPFTYGRRGTSGQSGSKTSEPVPYDKAKKAYDKVVKQKKAKGYQLGTGNAPGTVSGGSSIKHPITHVGITVAGITVETGIFPQLLCPIEDDEVEMFLKDARYGAQEKKDGRRKFMHRKFEGDGDPPALVQSASQLQVVSINRKGQEVSYPACFTDACIAIADNNQTNLFLLDGEEVGDIFHLFDILSFGKDLKNFPYKERYEFLQNIKIEEPFRLLPLAVTEAEKRELYEKLKKENKEGIVFKLLDAPYTEGRPSEEHVTYAQMCPQVKNKFYATATCIVLKVNTKRSVRLGLYEGDDLISVGNCTIPPNKAIPSVNELVEIRYLYAYKGGSLYQPTYKMPRDDIEREACVMAQLKYKAEEN
jgi:bifunctional non-homologous end joining protein LigD